MPTSEALNASGDAQTRLERFMRWAPRLAFAAALLLVVAYVLWFAVIQGNSLATGSGPWGEFGDFLGGVLNPILAFLSLLAILGTVQLQMQELQAAARERRELVEERRRSAEAFNEQNSVLQAQAFDSLFFQMLRLHNEIVSQMDLQNRETGKATKARDCFRAFDDRLLHEITRIDSGFNNVALAIEAYERFYEDNFRELGHYFRLLYHLVRLVDESAFDDGRKRIYTNLIRAQLSASEQVVLFFNCLSKWGKDKFKPLVEKYALLKTIPEVAHLSSQYRQAYEHGAYGREKELHARPKD